MRGEALQAALARTLGDPTLVLAYRLPDSRGYADAAGRPVLVPPVAADRATAPIEREGREVATLVYDASLDDDPEMVEAVRAAAAIALENERLQAESEARLAELQASRQRIVAAGDAERRRLERDLHDGAQQRLVALVAAAADDPGRIRARPRPARAARGVGERRARPLARRSCASSRAASIRPSLDHGLAVGAGVAGGALDRADHGRRATRREHLPEPVELAAYFVACEALANVGKYAAGDGGLGAPLAHGGRRRDRDRRRRRRRRGRGARLGPPRPGRPRRGARRPAARHQPAGRGTVVTAELPCGS